MACSTELCFVTINSALSSVTGRKSGEAEGKYIFNALAQAALYLIRLYLARQAMPVEPSILFHQIRTAVQVIDQTDLSFTRHSTTIAQICRDICRVAGIDLAAETQ